MNLCENCSADNRYCGCVVLDLKELWGTVAEDYFAELDAAEDADREAERVLG